MMIAVAIGGLLMALAVIGVQRTRNRLDAERATVKLRGLISQAQSVAATAGSRVGTDRLRAGPSCANAVQALVVPAPPIPGHLPTIAVLNATQVEVPVALTTVTPGLPDVPYLQMDCETFNFTTETNGAVQLTVPLVAETYTVAPSGRVTGPNPTMHLQITGTANPTRPYGFRVLSSGVICQSAMPSPPALTLCDEDV